MTPSGMIPSEPPAQRHSQTSVDAAESIRPNAETLRRKVLDFIVSQGVNGATDEEIQVALSMGGSTERPRRVELVAAGMVKDIGTMRQTSTGRKATVWVVV